MTAPNWLEACPQCDLDITFGKALKADDEPYYGCPQCGTTWSIETGEIVSTVPCTVCGQPRHGAGIGGCAANELVVQDPLAGLDFEVEEPVVVDLTSLSDYELTERRTEVHNALRKSHMLWAPRSKWTEEAKELHSTFTAIQVEQHRRRSS